MSFVPHLIFCYRLLHSEQMVANAGVVGRSGAFTESKRHSGIVRFSDTILVSVEEWDRLLSINARGPFLCYKYAGIQMIKQGRGGRIIGASSIAGKQGNVKELKNRTQVLTCSY